MDNDYSVRKGSLIADLCQAPRSLSRALPVLPNDASDVPSLERSTDGNHRMVCWDPLRWGTQHCKGVRQCCVPGEPSSREGSSSLSRAQAQRHSNYLLGLCLALPPFLQQRLPMSPCFLRETEPSAQPLLPSLQKGKGRAGSGGAVPQWEGGIFRRQRLSK